MKTRLRSLAAGMGSRRPTACAAPGFPALTPGPSPATGEGRKRFPSPCARKGKKGLTLYEVILALAIFLPALAVMGQAIATGGRAAVQSRMQTDAVLRCESLLAECGAGVRDLETVSGMSFDDGSVGWTWSLVVSAGPVDGLLQVDATVAHEDTLGQVNATCTLSRLLRDPEAIASEQEAIAEAEAEKAVEEEEQTESAEQSGSTEETSQ